ncbi:MAG TPA: DUF4232 domain-containing protein, partial [Pseudonocardiaceae bacterium]|nr:DUF4232 domain-containing protein [Pseudonocardiaceae bacterium]
SQSPSAQNTGGAGSQTVAAGATTPNTSTSDGSTSAGATQNPAPAGSSGSGSGSGAVAASHTGGVPECKANTLALSFGAGDAGMSQQYRVLRFTNTGKQTCAIVGFPGVSFVTGDNGQQVGAPAVRNGKIGAQVNLAPGAVASTVLHTVDTGVYDPGTCKPTDVRGYRVYAPDDTASKFIALPSGVQACANPADTGLGVVTIRPGLGDTMQYQQS